MMIELQNLGCHNINLVSPTSHVPAIIKSLSIAREKGLKLPLVYNTNAYDSVEVLKLLNGIIDIYMPDAKYSSDVNALKYSSAPNYFEIMKKAIKEMHRQVGDLIINEEGIAVKGLLVRHLVLPNNLAGTKEIVKFIAKEISSNTFINIMDQYFPYHRAGEFPELSRRISQKEFQEAINSAEKAGLKRLYRERC
jgi:putative pyruvate formate lyase activating enzyme